MVTANDGLGGDSDLDNLLGPGFSTEDAAVLEFDFECPVLQDTVISFQYVFTSDEYNEFVNDIFNDVFGFFLNEAVLESAPKTHDSYQESFTRLLRDLKKDE